MTRPAEVRAKENAQTGTAFETYRVGERVGPLQFDLEPAFIDEYIEAAGIDAELYRVKGRAAAPPQVLSLFLMGTLHQRYAPLPGTVMADLKVELRKPIWRDEVTSIVSEGVIEKKSERRGRRYVTWSADYWREDGDMLARFTNTFVVPG